MAPIADALAESFASAISSKEIDSAILHGKSTDGSFDYSWVQGDRTLLNGTKKPLSGDDILYLASATKIITTIAALQCVERGQLTLKGDASEMAPELSKLGIFKGFDDEDKPIVTPNSKPITLEHLLTHSSGMSYYFLDPDLTKWRAGNKFPVPREVAQNFIEPLKFPPGEGWMYGPSSDWAGVLVERASGLPLDEYIQQHICSPLGISSTDLTFTPVADGLGDRMIDMNPDDLEGNGISVTGGTAISKDLKGAYGGHGGYATANAFMKILYSIAANDEKLLSKATVEDMFQPHLEEAARMSLMEKLENPATSFFAQDTTGKNRNWGLGGLRIGDDGDNGIGEGSLTWGGGINSTWFIDPKNKICGFAAPQLGMPPNVMKAQELKTHFRNGLLKRAQAEARGPG